MFRNFAKTASGQTSADAALRIFAEHFFPMENTPTLINQLVEAIYSEPRAGRPMPARIELGPDLFPRFQQEHRKALAILLPEAGNVYPGSLCGVPIVEMNEPGAALVRLDGLHDVLMLTPNVRAATLAT